MYHGSFSQNAENPCGNIALTVRDSPYANILIHLEA